MLQKYYKLGSLADTRAGARTPHTQEHGYAHAYTRVRELQAGSCKL